MAKKLSLLTMVLACFAILGSRLGVDPAWSQGVTVERDIPSDPQDFARPSPPGSPSVFFNYVACYDYFTGQPQNCHFTHKLLGLEPPAEELCDPQTNRCTNAGHQHDFGDPSGRVLDAVSGI